jgi:hypothetical protein
MFAGWSAVDEGPDPLELQHWQLQHWQPQQSGAARSSEGCLAEMLSAIPRVIISPSDRLAQHREQGLGSAAK